MNFGQKCFAAFFAAGSLITGAAQAMEPGNVTIQFPAGTSCGALTVSGSPMSFPVTLGQATVGGNKFFFLPMDIQQRLGFNAAFSEILGIPFKYQATFNMTNSTYSFLVPNGSGAMDRSGTFTGTIADNGFGGFNISLSLDCGVTITGVTVYAGN